MKSHFCWSEYIKDPESIFYKLFDIVAYDNYSEEKIDKLCEIVIYSTDEVILFFLINFVKDGRTEKTAKFYSFPFKRRIFSFKRKSSFFYKNL